MSKEYNTKFEEHRVEFSVLYTQTDKCIKCLEIFMILSLASAFAFYALMGLYLIYINPPPDDHLNKYLGYTEIYKGLIILDASL